MKRKIFSVLFALVLVLSLTLVMAAPAGAVASNYAGYTLDGIDSDTAVWSTDQKVSGDYSVLLTHNSGASARAYVKLYPPTGITLAEFVAAPATYGFSYWRTEDKIGPQLELTFTDGGTGTVELWAEMALYDYVADDLTGQWIVKTASATEQCGYYGTGSNSTAFDYTTEGLGDLSTLLTDMGSDNADDDAAAMGLWEMTQSIVECGWSGDTQTAYVDDVTIDGVTYDLEPVLLVDDDFTSATLGWGVACFDKIQDAINAAATGYTITVAAGAYTENVDVDEEVTLTGASSATVTVTALDAAVSVFTVTASNVTISGFTATGVTGPYVGDQHAGIYFPAHVAGCNIHDNILTGNIVGILMIDTENTTAAGGNTFTSNIASTNLTSGIEMQHTYGNTFTSNTANSNDKYGFCLDSSRNNTFTGNTANSNARYGFWLKQGAGTTGSDYNTFTNNTANLNTMSGIRMTNLSGNSTYTGNTFDSNVIAGMELGGTAGDGISSLTGNSNSFSGNAIGIKIDTGATITSVVLHYSDIVGNTSYGVSNAGTGTLDAKYNYWGDPSGPTITATNPRGAGDAISTLVDYEPWLHTTKATVYPSGTRYYAYNLCELKQGWNIWSTPIALDAQADTWGEYKLLGVDLDLATGQNALWFNASTPGWETVTDSYQLRPCDAIYIKVASDQEAPILFSPNVSAPAKTLYVGWNLVSASYIDDMNSPNMANGIAPEDALASVYTVPGPYNTGYSQVVSPAVNQTVWSGVRGTAINTFTYVVGSTDMLPCEGYWVYMTNGGTLAGTVFTPVSPLLP